MKAVRQRSCDAQGRSIAHADGRAHFDQPRPDLVRYPEGKASGAAHDDMGRMGADQYYRRSGGMRSEVRAHELDLAQRQSARGNDLVDARIGENFVGSGLGTRPGHA
jgi:hypothetical protein